ncbi:unnamed protein product [Rotaria sordida]|uniref:F-box domain-containing protein n=1 Tax=Rotaria sordida TaxID=392033 RepID=A0A819VUH5_9BILA|nr:unnamed protein product [Rotaria sordida]
MSDYIPQISHKLEYLPNEILLEIFDYIQLNDLITQNFIAKLRLSNNNKLPEHEFSYIRSLILDTPTSKHIEMISPEILPRLEYLRVGYTHQLKLN